MTKLERLYAKMEKAGYTDEKICDFSRCKNCGGCCCKNNACAYVPDDLETEISKKAIENLLDSGLAIIYGVPIRIGYRKYEVKLYLCAPEKDAANSGIKISIMHNQCALLLENGCKLSKKERPSQGLALIPKAEGGCKCYIDFKKDIIDAWEKYSDILQEIVLERTGKKAQQIMENEFYAETYNSFISDKKITLPMYLKEKVQYTYIYKRRDSITIWEYTAIEILQSIHFLADYKGIEVEKVVSIMAEELEKTY